jgi:hypothetical protein
LAQFDETRVLDPISKLLEFGMSSLATHHNTQNEEMSNGEGQRKIYYTALAAVGRGKVNTSAYLRGTEMRFSFK